jgi:hypothetical protein
MVSEKVEMSGIRKVNGKENKKNKRVKTERIGEWG